MASKFGYFWNRELGERNTGAICPESSKRCEILNPQNIFDHTIPHQHYSFDCLHEKILSAVHDVEYIEYVRGAYEKKLIRLSSNDTVVTKNIFDQALLAASAGCHAIKKINNGELLTAFCAIRPPGHHANRMRAMGFCVFNNIAVAARHAQDFFDFKKILILDWDVHPGNGTQEIFYRDPNIFTLSFHQENLFPEAGRVELAGAEQGEGFNRNVPLPARYDVEDYAKVIESVAAEVATKFQPDLLLIASGFDAHKSDRVSDMLLTEKDFSKFTNIVLNATKAFTGGKTISFLEGGYNVPALRNSVIEHCKALSQFSN